MKAKEFNALKKQVKGGNLKGLKKDIIEQLTLKQAQSLEDVMLDIPLDEKSNKILDELVEYIDNLVQSEKVANKKAPKPEKVKQAPEKVKQEKQPKTKKVKPFDKVNVGDVVKFRVEGEEKEHNIIIIYKGVNHIVAIMEEDEREVFLIRKVDFNKQMFEWTDRYNETYNILVTL